MSEWGPGSSDINLSSDESQSESEEPDEGDSPDGQPETDSGASHRAERADDDLTPDERREGTVDDVLKRGEYAFLPVFGFNEGHVAVVRAHQRGVLKGREIEDPDKEPVRIDGKELSWWEDDSIMPKHPAMLVNPVGFTTADADTQDFRDIFRLNKGEQFVFSDSGGYQLMSMDDAEIVDSPDDHAFQDLNVYPERLVEWQVHNADAGATIDYPPYNISGDASFPDAADWGEDWADFFAKRRDKSADMTERMAKHLAAMRDEGDEQAQDYIFCPVIHGKPYPDGEQHSLLGDWHADMQTAAKKAGVTPRGWVVKPEPSHSFGQVALHLGYAAEALQDADYLHVLMVGGLLQKALIMYYAMRSEQYVTSDASSYAAGGKRRQFDLPKTARRRAVIISNRSDEEREEATQSATRLDRYPCRCAVCATVEREHGYEFVTEGTGSGRNATLNLHNLHQSLSIERTIDALLREIGDDIAGPDTEPAGNEFWRFLRPLASDTRVDDLHRAMGYVKLAQDEGIEAANRRYRVLWDSARGRTIIPASSSAADW